MDQDVKTAILGALRALTSNLRDPNGGRDPLTKVASAAVNALAAWEAAGKAVERHHNALARQAERAK